MEALILTTRQQLKYSSALGEYGAAALRRTLLDAGHPTVPSVRTIGRVLVRHGAVDPPRRQRRPAPPRGWYLPAVRTGRVELDSFDVVEGLVINDGPMVEVLTGISLHGRLSAAWPLEAVSAAGAVTALTAHWQTVGLPGYAQIDNDTRFTGPHQHRDVIGRVMRLCLSLGVVPVFAPPRESGFQAAVESFNGRWQATVWARFTFASLADLQAQSAAYIAASRQRMAVRQEGAPLRRAVPAGWQLDLQAPPHGQIVLLRRTDDAGAVEVLGHPLVVSPDWPRRLVRCEVDLDAEQIRFIGLRRRATDDQPVLHVVPYHLPRRPFRE